MCEKTEEMNNPAPLTMNGGWEKQVNDRAAAAAAEDQRRRSWSAQQKAQEIAERRIRRTMSALALGVALIITGAIYLNYVDGFPIAVAAGVVVAGNSLINFVIGWLFGRRSR